MEQENRYGAPVKDGESEARPAQRRGQATKAAEAGGRALARMVEALMKLPGIGRKSAQRLAFALLGMPRETAEEIARAIVDLKSSSRSCTVCHTITEDEVCSLCRDAGRDTTRICVVEEPGNVLVLEKAGIFRGRYHVLKGALSPLDGIGPEHLTISGLMERLKTGAVKEVFIATNPTVKGEATALYLAKLIKPLGITVTRIAYGLPVGGDIEYADDTTVQRAIEGRREM
jgi:recombination protein RecR